MYARRVLYRLTSLIVFAFILGTGLCAANDSINYIPEFHGVLRGRWDLDTEDGYSRFQVRNARVTIQGDVAPIISYKIQTDFCDRGSIKILDAFATVKPVRGMSVKVGQYRMPFGYESFRGPANYYFNNRSAIGRYVNNYRAVGLQLGYTLKSQPITFEAGVFNPTVITDHTKWVKKYAYASRVLYKPGDFVVAAGFESIIPDSVRVNLAGATVGWSHGNFYAEGEYMARWYTHNSHKTTHAYNIFASYGIPLRKTVFDTWSFQARVDGMSALASATSAPGADGKLATTEDGRTRLTLGTTLSYRYKGVRAAVRLNFEKYWYDKGHVAKRGSGDKLSAELIISF